MKRTAVIISGAAIILAALAVTSGLLIRHFSGRPSPVTSSVSVRPSVSASPSASSTEWVAFKAAREKLPTVNSDNEVSLIAVGDIMLSRSVAAAITKHNDPTWPFQKIIPYLKSGDIVFGNLETPLTAGPPVEPNQMVFHSDPAEAAALKSVGFTILSLANNHVPNFGQSGIINTLKYLDAAGLAHAGAGKDESAAGAPAIITSHNLRFAFLAYNDHDVVPSSYGAGADHYGTNLMNIPDMIKAVQAAKTQADFVIVSMHSGHEYSAAADASQVAFAHAAIDAGADLVIGHHPHVVQPLEKYHGHYIFYSLGNFVFDQLPSETRVGLSLKIEFDKNGVKNVYLYPISLNGYQPQLLGGAAADNVLARLDYPLATSSAWTWEATKESFASTTVATLEATSSAVEIGRMSGQYNISKTEIADLDGDGQPETYSLAKGRLTIQSAGRVIWQSPLDWWIDDFALADSNNDGRLDLNMSVWKSGDYGPSKPFWVKTNDESVKNHFFIFDLKNGALSPVWQSSNLTVPNCAFRIAPIGDNKTGENKKNELVVLEGSYADWPYCQPKNIAVWSWNGWGFTNEGRVPSGAAEMLLSNGM